MLKINKLGQVEFEISHLQSKEMTTFEEVVERYCNLELRLFYHGINDPNCRYEKVVGKKRLSNDIANMEAEERFNNILKNGHISANPKGFFADKMKDDSENDLIKSVSFSFAKWEDMRKIISARGSDYGICFFHDFLLKQNIRPVLYLNNKDPEIQEKAVFNNPHLIEIYSQYYDMRWEYEWRTNNDLNFKPDDVAFIIVPDNKYLTVLEDEIYSDYFSIPASTYKSPLDFMLNYDFLKNNGWSQIKLFRHPKYALDGLIMDFEEFFPLTKIEEKKILTENKEILESHCKCILQRYYERKYIGKYNQFISNLKSKYLNNTCFANLDNIKSNLNETFYSERDLIISFYEGLFRLQEDKIVKSWDMF